MRVVNWKPIIGINIDEKPSPMGQSFFDREETLFEHILAMPKKQPISLQKAWIMAQEEIMHYTFHEQDFKRVDAIVTRHWTATVTDLGYHIELRGDEYETKAGDA